MGNGNCALNFYTISNYFVIYETFIQYGIQGVGALYALYKMYRT